MNTKQNKILHRYAKQGTIQGAVARHFLAQNEGINRLRDVCDHGCASGMVTDMVRYAETHEFFELHYREIEQMRLEVDHMNDIPPGDDLKNRLAWTAYEERARELLEQLEEEG
jgi:hypothetical protein